MPMRAGLAAATPASDDTAGPRRNGRALAVLALVLASAMLAENLLWPFQGAQHADLNRLAVRVTAGLFLLAALSALAVFTGRTVAGRLGLVAYGGGLAGVVAVVLGPDTGVDVLAAAVLVFAPFLLFGGGERAGLALACTLSLGSLAAIQAWLALGPGPLFSLPPALLAEVRAGLVLVAAGVGALVVWLYRAAERARALAAREQARSEALLLNVLPKAVADRLKDGATQVADDLAEITVLFADIAGFTRFSADRPAVEVVALLDGLFARFDALCAEHGVEKLKTIGDGYMAVAGAPGWRPDHAAAAARLALGMQREMASVRARHPTLALRVGLNSGPAVAGVIGTAKFAYDLWGDTVNLASRLESHAAPGAILVSAATRAMLGGGFALEGVGTLDVKGKGPVPAWRLLA